jgi:hypothetical protein
VKILAIDPGERVGWATGEVLDGELTVKTHGITALRDFAIKLAESFGNYDVVVYETWRLTQKGARVSIGSDMQSSQLVGMIRLLAWLNPKVKLVSQPPAAKSTAERTLPEWLREKIAKLPKAHDDAHDGDALLHIWKFYWERFV